MAILDGLRKWTGNRKSRYKYNWHCDSLVLLCRLLDVVHSARNLYLVFEYCDQDLKAYLDKLGSRPLPAVHVQVCCQADRVVEKK